MHVNRTSVALVLVTCGVIAGAGYFFFAQRWTDRDSVVAPISGDSVATPNNSVFPVTPQEFQKAVSRWPSRSFRVRYRWDRPSNPEMTWYHEPNGTSNGRLRIDLVYRGVDGLERNRTYVEDGDVIFSCREPGRCSAGSDLFDGDALDVILLVFLLQIFTLGETGTGTGDEPNDTIDSSASIREIAGHRAQCFSVNRPTVVSRYCFSEDDGIPLFLGSDRAGSAFTALDFDLDVKDSDFSAPYPLEH